MKLLRSWPEVIPTGRNFVVDDIPKLIMKNYDYSVLADVADDILLIEWDVAVGMEELTRFVQRAAATPDKVLAAPYRLYSGFSTRLPKPEWTAWRYHNNDQIQGGTYQVEPGTPTAHITSFGFTYLPRHAILGYLAARDRAIDGKQWRFSDISFFGWHYRCVEQEVRLDWSVKPVHLHYELPSEIKETVGWPRTLTHASVS